MSRRPRRHKRHRANPRTSRAALFSRLNAKLWIDKQEMQWTKAEANVIDTISIGWILARIAPGANIVFERTRVSASDWLPKLINVDGAAKLLLLKGHPINERVTYYDYKPVAQMEFSSLYTSASLVAK